MKIEKLDFRNGPDIITIADKINELIDVLNSLPTNCDSKDFPECRENISKQSSPSIELNKLTSKPECGENPPLPDAEYWKCMFKQEFEAKKDAWDRSETMRLRVRSLEKQLEIKTQEWLKAMRERDSKSKEVEKCLLCNDSGLVPDVTNKDVKILAKCPRCTPKEVEKCQHRSGGLGACPECRESLIPDFSTHGTAGESRPVKPKGLGKCKHCGMDIAIRNPSGYCDHLYYPDNCDICSGKVKPKDSLEDVISEVLNKNQFWSRADLATAIRKHLLERVEGCLSWHDEGQHNKLCVYLDDVKGVINGNTNTKV